MPSLKDAILQLLSLADPGAPSDPQAVEARYSELIRIAEAAQLSPATHERLLQAAEDFVAARLGECRALDASSSSLADRIAGRPGFLGYFNMRKRAATDLRRFVHVADTALLSAGDPTGERLTGPVVGLTDQQQLIWEHLKGRSLTAKELANQLSLESEEAVRGMIRRIRESGRDIGNQRGVGYYRPDAPPEKWFDR